MAQSVVLGPTAKVDLGYLPEGENLGGNSVLTPLRILGGKLFDSMTPMETSDTDTLEGCQEFFPKGYGCVSIQFDAQLDLDPGPTGRSASIKMFIRPLYLTPGGTIQMYLWPQGRGVLNSNWTFYRVLLLSGTHNIEVQGSTPQRFSVEGVTSGYYKRPYEMDRGGSRTPPYAESLLPLYNRTIRPLPTVPPH